MAKLTPNASYQMAGVTIHEKIIPDGTRWTDAVKAAVAGFSANALYKAQKLLCGTGKASFVTIHNTNDLLGTYDDGEQYTRATWPNQNMNSSRVHFYVDDTGAWQNLRAGTGLCPNDPVGKAEASWHSGDGSVATGGNMTSISIEIIMNESAEHDAVAKDNGARIAAWLLWHSGLAIDKLVTHTYWVNKQAGKTFSDVDTQCTNPISGKKWCPTYIFASNNAATAKKNWLAFKAIVAGYLAQLSDAAPSPAPAPIPSTDELYRVRKAWADADSQLGAFKDLDYAKRLVDTNPGYAVYNSAGKAVYPAAETFPYKVQISVPDLRVRTGPGTDFNTTGKFTGAGTFAIEEKHAGEGSAAGWGYIKTLAGWVALDYCTKQ